MAKAVDRGMSLNDIHLVAKSGGQSGNYVADGSIDVPENIPPSVG
jgi:hypothetical protein